MKKSTQYWITAQDQGLWYFSRQRKWAPTGTFKNSPFQSHVRLLTVAQVRRFLRRYGHVSIFKVTREIRTKSMLHTYIFNF